MAKSPTSAFVTMNLKQAKSLEELFEEREKWLSLDWKSKGEVGMGFCP